VIRYLGAVVLVLSVLGPSAHVVAAEDAPVLAQDPRVTDAIRAWERSLELNPDHALVKRLKTWHEQEPEGERFANYTNLLYGQALVREGEQPPDPSRFATLITELMLEASE